MQPEPNQEQVVPDNEVAKQEFPVDVWEQVLAWTQYKPAQKQPTPLSVWSEHNTGSVTSEHWLGASVQMLPVQVHVAGQRLNVV